MRKSHRLAFQTLLAVSLPLMLAIGCGSEDPASGSAGPVLDLSGVAADQSRCVAIDLTSPALKERLRGATIERIGDSTVEHPSVNIQLSVATFRVRHPAPSDVGGRLMAEDEELEMIRTICARVCYGRSCVGTGCYTGEEGTCSAPDCGPDCSGTCSEEIVVETISN